MGCGKFIAPAVDIGAELITGGTATPFLPLINAGVNTGVGLAEGESLGKAAGQGAISGVETLGLQELGGAVGVGPGNTAFNDALGITGDNPAALGLPDIGAMFNNAVGGATSTPAPGTLPSTAIGENAAGAGINASGATVTAPASPTSTAPSSGGGFSSAGSILSGGGTDSILQQSLAPSSLPSTAGASLDSAIGAAGTDSIGAVSQAGAAASAPPTGASSGSGLSSWLPAKADVGKAVLSSALPLAAAGFEAAKGPAKLPADAKNLQSGGAATAPLLGIEQQQATEAQTGQLTPSQQANIEQYVQDQQNLILQQLAGEGVANPQQDSRYIGAMNDLQQKVLAMQNNYVQQAIGNATSAGGAASANISSAANMQIQNDKDFQDALAAAFGALGGNVTQKAA